MSTVEELTQVELSKRLGITPRAIRKLHDHGIPRLDNGRYPWPDVRHWYIRFKQDEAERRRGGGEELDLRAEQARKTAAQADEAELRLAERRRELVHIRDVEEMVREPLELVAAALKNAPSRYASDLAEAADIPIPRAMRLLEDIVERIRSDLRRARDEHGDTAA